MADIPAKLESELIDDLISLADGDRRVMERMGWDIEQLTEWALDNQIEQ